jgi:hypothetical protein
MLPPVGIRGAASWAAKNGPRNLDRAHQGVLGHAVTGPVGQVSGGHDQVADRCGALEQACGLGAVADVGRNRAESAWAAKFGLGCPEPLGGAAGDHDHGVKRAGLAPREKSSGRYAGRAPMTGQGRPALRLASWLRRRMLRNGTDAPPR